MSGNGKRVRLSTGTRVRAVLLALTTLCVGWTSQSAAQHKLLVRNAQIVSMQEAEESPYVGYILVDADGRIAAIGEGDAPTGTQAKRTVDASGMIVMPGFVSGHSHLAASVRRGRLPDKELDGLIDNPVPHFGAEYYRPGDLHAFALHGAVDYLRNGITAAFEYPIRPRNLSEDLYKEMLAAELKSGMRLVYGYNVPDLPLEQARAAFVAFKEYADALGASNPRLLKLALAKTGHLGRWGHDIFPTEVAIAKEFGLDLQLHFLESNYYQRQNRADFSMMEDVGALSVGLIYGHFIHHSDEILQKSVVAGARMIWNPLSNGRLASGLADVPKYLKAGMTVGMGLDGQSTADLSDPFENMRMGLYSQRMKYRSAAILSPLDMLRLHTIGTARAIGVAQDIGSLEVGKYADFLLVDPADPDTGPIHDTYATLVFGCSSANVTAVFVGGDQVVRDGQPLLVDAAKLAKEVKERANAMQKRASAVLSALTAQK